MKVLSLKQPYAELVVRGKKRIELRNWNTKYRGEFLVHASKNPDRGAMKRLSFENLPRGYIGGKVTLVDVKHSENEEEHQRDKDLHLADSGWGDYGFVLESAQRMEPIEVKGKLGFWNYEI